MTEKNKKGDAVEKASDEKEISLPVTFGTVFIRINKETGQIMRPIKANVALSYQAGHFYSVAKKYAISGPGYRHLNKVASINLVTPQKVIVDGVEKSNPCVERNAKTKAIETVNIRKIGIGYSPAGNITIIDKTLFYNIYTYFIQSVQAKMKKVEWKDRKATDIKIHPDCAVIGTEKERPEKDGRWAFFETVHPLGLWVNYDDPAIMDCLEEHTQRQRFGDRIAQTIVERNILKDHPAIGIGQVQPTGDGENKTASVIVYGYRHELDPGNITEILQQAETGSEMLDIRKEVIKDIPEEEEKEGMKDIEEISESDSKDQKLKFPEDK